MEDILIKSSPETPYFPEVNFNANTGLCEISGESYMEETYKFFLPLSSWIKDYINNIRKGIEFEKRCVRGLMDTDGCIFNKVHKMKNKQYSYKRLSLVSASPMLRKSIFDILEKLRLSPKIRGNRSVQIENKEKIAEYFKVVGSSNPKHLNRYHK